METCKVGQIVEDALHHRYRVASVNEEGNLGTIV